MSIVLGELLTGRPSNVKLQTGFNMEIIYWALFSTMQKSPYLGEGGTQSLELLI